ncbi:hypothetical protein ColTof4_00994 [Colletotrichum tofieldiae]|nr:hypothetical protein ColTof3_08216 [Colletotrichum tofieldiae]GKT68571.1 hypothetical protein ColTof4_00994 [Colletotrichum tofieldiae]GKT90397.1 hypothetical protein Ct61P_08247 [Colletotrichum tofieldiae]
MVLHLSIAGIASEDETLTKRAGAAGFKISYTTCGHSKLAAAHRREMSGWGAAEFANNAQRNSMMDLYGFTETGHPANFYYRIIPEMNSFRLNCESVDICGGMAAYLWANAFL